MRASEFMRKLADLIDCVEKMSAPEKEKTEETGETASFVPPLQQKIELLKKATGVESYYDDNSTNSDDNQLNQIKKNAGLIPAIIDNDDDFPDE